MSKWAVWFLMLIAAIGSLLAFMSAINVYMANDFALCFQPGCFAFAYGKYKESVEIIIGTGVIVAYLAALGGSYLAMRTYLDSVSRDSHDRHLANFNLFKTGVADLNPGFGLSNLNANAFYYFVFPDSKQGKCIVSARYIDLVSSIKEKIALSNSIFGSANPWDRAEHCEFMNSRFGEIGIEVEEVTDELIIELEPRVFAFIDLVSSRVLDVPTLIGSPYRSYAS